MAVRLPNDKWMMAGGPLWQRVLPGGQLVTVSRQQDGWRASASWATQSTRSVFASAQEAIDFGEALAAARETPEAAVPRSEGRLCLWCGWLEYSNSTPDWSEMTPGSDFAMECRLGRWRFDEGTTTLERHRANLLMAETCRDYVTADGVPLERREDEAPQARTRARMVTLPDDD